MEKRTCLKLLSLLLVVCMLAVYLPAQARAETSQAALEPVSSAAVDSTMAETAPGTLTETLPEISTTTEPLDEGGILKLVDQAEFESKQFTARLTEQEELNSYVFKNAEGQCTAYFFDENVKFVKDGKVLPKDLSLVPKNTGYGIAQNEFDLQMPMDPSQGITVDYEGYTLRLTPQSVAEDVAAQTQNGAVIYAGAFGANTALMYTPLFSGVKEDIILFKYIRNPSYSFLLETDGLNLYNDSEGYYLAPNEKAEATFRLGNTLVYDAVGRPCTGTLTVQTVEDGAKYQLTLGADDSFLSDPTTVYPVTIDPTITISDTATGTGSIEDVPVFAGHPNSNFGTFIYNSVGTTDASYGVARTIVRLKGLIDSTIYQSLTADKITNVKFYVTESSGTSSQFIHLYPLHSNASWQETDQTWNTIGYYRDGEDDEDYGTTLSNNQKTFFDITELVKGWRSFRLPIYSGFIMINDDETKAKSFYSSECSTTSRKPYVEMTYIADISLNFDTLSMCEGSSFTFTATTYPSGQTITWSTSNSTVATVSSSGVVTAEKAGTATITARFIDSEGETHSASCTIFVVIENGVYYIKNLNSNYYLHVKNGEITNYTDVYQFPKVGDSNSVTYHIRQMWKIKHLGDGRYSIRPMSKLDMGLDVTEGNVDIFNIATSDTLSAVPLYAEWIIEWYATGYVFKNNGYSSKTMQIKDASTSAGSSVVAGAYSTSVNCRWGLTKITSPPSGAYLYDTLNKSIVTAATKYVNVGVAKGLSDLQLCAVAFSGTNIDQSFTWNSSNTPVATVDPSGDVTGASAGGATINGCIYRDDSYHYVSYSIRVTKLLIYQTEKTYYYDAEGNNPEDLEHGDMSEDELRALDWVNWTDFASYTPEQHRDNWEDMCIHMFATGELEVVILDMIDRFMSGSGLPYRNSVLTQKAYAHNSTQNYIEKVEEQIGILLNTYEGNISALAYEADSRESNLLVQALQANNVYQPVYNTWLDKTNGLTICIDGLWGNKIEVISYSINDNSYSYTLRYTLYDHFGLDQADVEEYGYLDGFRSWYILQHYSGYNSAYRPFLTMIEFDVTVTGFIS